MGLIVDWIITIIALGDDRHPVQGKVRNVVLVFAVLFSPYLAEAQTAPVKNPTLVAFTSPDHALVDRYEIDLIRVSDSTVVQTLTVLKADTTVVNGEVQVTINVQPVAFGQYKGAVRAVAGTLKSSTSLPSEIWERVPGGPSKPTFK